MTELCESAKPEAELVVEPTLGPILKGEPQVEVEEVGDTSLDIPDDDLNEVLNALGDDDVNFDDLKSELASLEYMPIQFDIFPPDFAINTAFILPSVFKANPGQPSLFEEDFKGEAKTHDPLIAEVESSHSIKNADDRVGRHTRTAKVKTLDILKGVDDRETLLRVTVCRKSSKVFSTDRSMI